MGSKVIANDSIKIYKKIKNKKNGNNKMKNDKKTEIFDKKEENKEEVSYMSKTIYKNYEKGMKERNKKRIKKGLKAIPLRTFEDWSNV